jgi:hypothetical protein
MPQLPKAFANSRTLSLTQEIRLVVFPLTRNNKANAHMQTLLASIHKGEGHQIQGLLLEIKRLSELCEKRDRDLTESDKDLKKKTEDLERVKRDADNRLL